MSETLDMFVERKAVSTHPLRFYAPKESDMAETIDHAFKSSVRKLEQFERAMQVLAVELQDRVTMRQALTFAMIARRVAMGQDVTIAELRKDAGEDASGAELLGVSIGRSYQLFLEPTDRKPDALGWAYVEVDQKDNRRKLLRLTEKGKEFALRVSTALTTKN